jgi:hypothetical protein
VVLPLRETQLQPREISNEEKGADSTRPASRHREAPVKEARQAAPTWARSVGSLTGLENSRFSMQPVAVATLNLFCKNYSIVFFVHFGRGELYLEMMVQDKLANPCQAILMELAICFCQRFGERKSEAERRDGWNEVGAQRPPPCR